MYCNTVMMYAPLHTRGWPNWHLDKTSNPGVNEEYGAQWRLAQVQLAGGLDPHAND